MSVLTPWRQALRPLIPKGFLRRDQGDGLFVSDYPRYEDADAVSARIEKAGFRVTVTDGLARIVPAAETLAALLDAAPACTSAVTDENLFLHSLARRIAEADAPLTPENEKAVWTALKFLDAEDMSGLYRFLSPAAALAQRKHLFLPAGLGRMILRCMSECIVQS
ncbi:MAG: hypothetical protein IJP78_06525 [Clostridia bacterium]|nr:hypothetical protein [Clostridia bacterium]